MSTAPHLCVWPLGAFVKVPLCDRNLGAHGPQVLIHCLHSRVAAHGHTCAEVHRLAHAEANDTDTHNDPAVVLRKNPERAFVAQQAHLGAQVPWAQDVVYLAGYEQGLELGWQVVRPVGDVEVPDA